MLSAIHQGNFLKALNFIDHGYNVNIQDKDGRTPLIECAFMKDVSKGVGLARALLANGAEISHADSHGLNVLHYSCIQQSPFFVDVLLSALDCDVNLRCYKTGNTALHFSAIAGNLDITTKLVNHILKFKLEIDIKNKSGATALQLAFNFHNTEIAKKLIKCGAKIDATSSGNDSGTDKKRREKSSPVSSNVCKQSKLEPEKLRSSFNGVFSLSNRNPAENMKRSFTSFDRRHFAVLESVDNRAESSWREAFPLIWSKYTQQTSSSFRSPAIPRIIIEESHTGSAVVVDAIIEDQVSMSHQMPKDRRYSLFATTNSGPRSSRKGYQPTKPMSKDRRQSVPVLPSSRI